jgi:ubiquinol-cytochrome c reductase iron-sulfur subunit
VEERKGFTYMVMGTLGMSGAVAIKNIVYDALASSGIAASVLAASTTEVDLAPIAEGATAVVMYRGKPTFVRHRTPAEIETARKTSMTELKDPQKDEDRVVKPEWLLVLAVCTHLGCVPVANAGEYNGWFCPCHGSHYDLSGRIRRGPAPLNLEVPPHYFVDDSHLLVGAWEPQ